MNGGTNTELLAGRKVSTAGRSANSLREQSANTGILRRQLGALSSNQGFVDRRLAAGTSSWISETDRQPAQKVGGGLDENFLGSLQRVKLSDTDTIGRKLSAELQEQLKNTVFKTEDGKIISFFHWTPSQFEVFKYGDGAFHFGTLPAAVAIKEKSDGKQQGYFKEVYINSKNPLVVYDNGSFSPSIISGQLVEYGLMSTEERKEMSAMNGFYSDDCNSEACKFLHNYIKELGFDSYFYKNKNENTGTWSVGVFDANQIITVAENGILKENSGVSEADLDNESAFSMDENADSQRGAKGITEPDISKDTRSHEQRVVEKMNGKESAREKDRREVKRLGKLIGWEVRFDDVYARDKAGNIVYITDEDGKPILDKNGNPIPKHTDAKVNKKNKIITMDYNNSKPIKTLLKHELTHFLETNAGVYRDFLNKVIESDAFKNWLQISKKMDLKAYRDSVINEYKGTNGFETAENSQISAEFEMVSEFVEENLFGDGTRMVEEIVKQMNAEQRSKFARFIDGIIEKLKNFFKGKKQLSEIELLEQEWLKAYKAAEQTWQQQKNTTENSGEQYAIGHTKDNKPVAIIDEDILAGVSKSKWVETVKRTITDKFSKGIPISGRLIRVNQKTKNEYTESKYTKFLRSNDGTIYEDKLKSANNLDEIILASTNYVNEDLNHTRKDKIKEFARGDVLIRVGGNDYSAKVIIGFTSGNNMVLYDIIEFTPTKFEIKKESAPNSLSTVRSGALSNNNIPYSNNVVNSNSMQNNEEYSLASDNDTLLSMYENGDITREEYLRGIEKTEPERVANYTETQYNNFGWVRYNEILDNKDIKYITQELQNINNGNRRGYVKTKYGDYIIPLGDKYNILVYTDNDVECPHIRKVLEIKCEEQILLDLIRSDIEDANNQKLPMADDYVKRIYGAEYFVEYKRQDFLSFRKHVESEQERMVSGTDSRIYSERNRRGNAIQESIRTSKAELENSAFSVPGEEQYSLASDNEVLLSMYENGEITREEFLRGFNTKSYGLKEITDLNVEDANVLQPINKIRKESDGDSDSKFWESLQKSKWFDDGLKVEFAGDEFIEKYKSVSNKETLLEAKKELEEGGAAYVQRWHNLDAKHASLIDTAVGFILLDGYRRNGDTVSAVATAEKLRQIGTAGGQQIQIFSILGRLSPEAMLQYAQRELDKAYEIMVEKRSKKWIDKNKSKFSLTKEDQEFIERRVLQASILPEGRDKAVCLAEIAARIQDKLPPERSQGLKAWQRISMLLNPKTNVRNILGNATIAPVFIVSDFFGAGIDKLVSKATGVRTTGMFGSGGLKENAKAFKKGAWETLDDFKRHINTRNQELNRFDLNTQNMTGKSFNENHNGVLAKQLNDCAKVLNALDRMTSFCLEMGDRPFYEMWFVNSINNQMKLNNAKEPTPEMITIASAEALQRTWQDGNSYVTMVQNIKRGLNTLNIHGYGLGDVFVKFSKTPANLTKAIVDFSPVGLVKGLSVDAVNFKNALETGRADATTQKRFVDSLSKGIAGTMLYVLFAALAANGLITGAGDEDKDANAMEKYILGVPEYSIKLFGKWWSYEWMQPIGGAMAIVADYMESNKENPNNEWYENISEAIRAGGEVLYNQSFMQSLQTLFTADGIIDGVVSGILDDPSVLIPQFVSQIASATDKYRRVTYSNKNPWETAINKVKVKLPGIRQSLEIDKDILGRDVKNSQGNFIDAFLNPANTYIASRNDVTDEIYKLYKNTGDKTVIPRKAANSVTVKGQTHYFEIKEKNEYQRVMGETTNEILEDIFKSVEYQTFTDSEKVKLINEVFDYATAMAKAETVTYYDILSAIYGDALSETKYNSLSEKAKEALATEYFLSDYYYSNGKSKIDTTEAEYFLEKVIKNRSKKKSQYTTEDINKIANSK